VSARERLIKFLEDTKSPRNRVATGLGISPTTFSQYLNGKYPGDNAKIDEAVIGFLERQTEREAGAKIAPAAGYAQTRQAKMATNVLRACHIDGDMGVIISNAGLGKTTAISHYARQNDGVIYLTARPTVNIKVLLVQIAEAIKIHSGGVNDRLLRAIVKMLDGTGRMIILDEAQFLTGICLETLRYIHDEAGVGLVYAGMPALHQVIMSEEHIHSRVGAVAHLPPLDERDVRAILEATGTRITDSGVKALAHDCDGSARRLMKILKHACRLANGAEVTPSAITTATKQIMVA